MSSKKKQPSVKKAQALKNTNPANPLVPHREKNLLFLPVLLALAIIPLIVHLKIASVDSSEAVLIGAATYGDFFSQAKASILLVIGISMLILGILFHKKSFDKNDRIFYTYLIAGGVFVLFTFLSAMFSEYSTIAFWGVHDRAEGAIAIFCYIILFLYTIYAYRTERDFKNILIALGIVVTLSAILGFFQYFGHDLLSTNFGKALTISPWDQDKVGDLNFLSSSGRLYGTFYHWDYVGSFAAIVVPLFFVLALASRSLRARFALWGMTLLSLWLLIGSTSRAGIVGVFIAFIFGIIFFAKIIARHWKVSLSCFAILLVASIGAVSVSKGTVLSRIPSLFEDIGSAFQKNDNTDYLSKLPVKDIDAKNNEITIVTQQNDVLKATLNDNTLELKDGNGQSVSIESKNGKGAIADQRFQKFAFGLVKMGLDQESRGISVSIDGRPQFYFRIESNGNLQFTNASGTADIDSLKAPPSFGFKGKEQLGSARGYIWSRAIPMIPGNLLLGSGPDTFVLNFPQNDLLGKYWAYGTANMLIDKPHNLYLQTILGEGGIALLAFLLIVFLYVIDSIRLYALKKEYRTNQIFGAAVCLGVVGYLFAGFFNDSVVSVAPVFWILLGVGVAVNFQNRRELLKDKE